MSCIDGFVIPVPAAFDGKRLIFGGFTPVVEL
jgi:uncharacterized protein YbaA (DUF1428 family)